MGEDEDAEEGGDDEGVEDARGFFLAYPTRARLPALRVQKRNKGFENVLDDRQRHSITSHPTHLQGRPYGLHFGRINALQLEQFIRSQAAPVGRHPESCAPGPR